MLQEAGKKKKIYIYIYIYIFITCGSFYKVVTMLQISLTLLPYKYLTYLPQQLMTFFAETHKFQFGL